MTGTAPSAASAAPALGVAAAGVGAVRAVPFRCLRTLDFGASAAAVLVADAPGPAGPAAHGRPGPDRLPAVLRAGAAALGLALEGELRAGPRGRPYLDRADGGVPVDFNISHSGGLVAVALGPVGPLGLDVQERAGEDWERIAARWLHPEEQAELAACDAVEAADLFTRYWAVREARCKATGVGLAGFRSASPLRGLGRARGENCLGSAGGCCDGVWWRELPAPGGYAAALAYAGPDGAGWLHREVVTGRL